MVWRNTGRFLLQTLCLLLCMLALTSSQARTPEEPKEQTVFHMRASQPSPPNAQDFLLHQEQWRQGGEISRSASEIKLAFQDDDHVYSSAPTESMERNVIMKRPLLCGISSALSAVSIIRSCPVSQAPGQCILNRMLCAWRAFARHALCISKAGCRCKSVNVYRYISILNFQNMQRSPCRYPVTFTRMSFSTWC